MENVSKALIIAASVLIAVMLFAFMLYVFGRFSVFSESTEKNSEDLAVEKFNSQFDTYATTEEYSISSFGHPTSKTMNNKEETKAKRYMAAKELNTISDVITVVNLAVSTNYTNNGSYHYNTIERENAVEVIIDLKNVYEELNLEEPTEPKIKKYYIIEPNKNVKANYVYGTDINPAEDYNKENYSKDNNIKTLFDNFEANNENKLSTYTLLEKMRKSKTTVYQNKTYTIYKYYFVCDYKINKKTNKIDSIRFIAIKDKGFDLVE